MIEIRPYQDPDFNRLAEIHDAARRQELAAASLSCAFVPFAIASKREKLFAYQVYVAQKDQKVVGFIAFHEDEIGWLYVDVTRQKEGIGSALVAFALAHGTSEMELEVIQGNEQAKRLYKKFGFYVSEVKSGRMPGNESITLTVDVMKRGA